MTKEQQIVGYILENNISNVKDRYAEIISKLVPSLHHIVKATNVILKGKHGATDSQDNILKDMCKTAWELSEQGKSEEYIYKAIYKPQKQTLAVGTRVTSLTHGNGVIVKIYSDKDLCSIHFETKKLPCMCSISKKQSVHNDKEIIKFNIQGE